MKYSQSHGCFYPEDIQYDTYPDDLIDVTEEEAHAALNRESDATLDVVDGKLVIVPPPPASLESRMYSALYNITQHIENKTLNLPNRPPHTERETGWFKHEAAIRIKSGTALDSVSQALLDGLGLKDDAVKQAWADAVLVRAVEYAWATGLNERLIENAEVACRAATNQEELDAAVAAQTAAIDEAFSAAPPKPPTEAT